MTLTPRRTLTPLTLTAVLAATGLVLAGCGTSGTTASTDKRLKVVTTVAPLTSIAGSVAGNRARVEGIIPEGTDSHTYEPAPQVAKALSTADLVVINGLALEEPTKELAQRNLKKGAAILEVGTKAIPESQWIYDFSFPKKDGKPNPHLWTDPVYAAKYATIIADAMAKADKPNASYYRANAAAFGKQAKALGDAMRADQKSVPRRVLLTYHDAYAYFGRDFGWQIIGAVQPKDFQDPAPAEIARLITQIKAEKVPTIFGSEVYPSAVLAEIGRATGARYESSLRDDDLPGKPGDAEHSWLGLMRYDFTTMVTGLGGTATQLKTIPLTAPTTDEAVYPQ
ncbi:MAG TPA: zinc ABC transporter substrate-binding protein [Actinobacteria bacterium]|nr:zinc ABC transporter substrate-binding protein [Actinomycetota bacterium]